MAPPTSSWEACLVSCTSPASVQTPTSASADGLCRSHHLTTSCATHAWTRHVKLLVCSRLGIANTAERAIKCRVCYDHSQVLDCCHSEAPHIQAECRIFAWAASCMLLDDEFTRMTKPTVYHLDGSAGQAAQLDMITYEHWRGSRVGVGIAGRLSPLRNPIRNSKPWVQTTVTCAHCREQ